MQQKCAKGLDGPGSKGQRNKKVQGNKGTAERRGGERETDKQGTRLSFKAKTVWDGYSS